MINRNRNRLRYPFISLISAWVVLIFTCGVLHADIYMYIDQNGIVHFTNAPTRSAVEYRLFIEEDRNRAAYLYSPDQFDAYIREASDLHGVSFPLLKAVIKAESDFNPKAISKKGAMGLMQIMPKNFEALNISDPFDPWENIMGGARYLRKMLDRFNGKLSLSLAAYNAGPTTVERYNNQIPPFKETEDYIERVLSYYYTFKY